MIEVYMQEKPEGYVGQMSVTIHYKPSEKWEADRLKRHIEYVTEYKTDSEQEVGDK